jgi:acetate kinase
MKILVANIGSTSLKYRLFDFADGRERMLARGGIERVTDYGAAIEVCLGELRQGGWVRDESDVAAVGFKTVMARGLTGCARLDEDALTAMEACATIAPAHNPPYVAGIRQFARSMPGTPLVGLFEDAFYQWAPAAAMRYAVPEAWHQQGVRRRGFHGASHKYIAERSAELLGRPDVAQRARDLYAAGGPSPARAPSLRVISCHLGGSSSITGIRDGVAIGNSLGMSPQSGLPHNNRVGDLDPMALPYLMRAGGLDLDEIERVLCRESGLRALSGGLNDARELLSAAGNGDARAQLALEVFVHAARHWLGAYLVELGGADAIVFTGGIGENQPSFREWICAGLQELGIALDHAANAAAGRQDALISAAGARVNVMVIPANEELVVAREVKRFMETARPLNSDSDGARAGVTRATNSTN